MEYDNTNTGALFKNDKEGNDKRPDYKGTLDVEGVRYNVSSWVQTAKGSGQKFMSLVLELHKPNGTKSAPASKQKNLADMDDDIPF